MATYRLEFVRCSKPRCWCNRARGGRLRNDGHGPYWYAYWREGDRVHKKYIGKRAPHGARNPNTPPPAAHTSKGTDDYSTIGVNPGSSWDDVRRAYRRAAFAAHPDRGGGETKMKGINAAYERLKRAHTR